MEIKTKKINADYMRIQPPGSDTLITVLRKNEKKTQKKNKKTQKKI